MGEVINSAGAAVKDATIIDFLAWQTDRRREQTLAATQGNKEKKEERQKENTTKVRQLLDDFLLGGRLDPDLKVVADDGAVHFDVDDFDFFLNENGLTLSAYQRNKVFAELRIKKARMSVGGERRARVIISWAGRDYLSCIAHEKFAGGDDGGGYACHPTSRQCCDHCPGEEVVDPNRLPNNITQTKEVVRWVIENEVAQYSGFMTAAFRVSGGGKLNGVLIDYLTDIIDTCMDRRSMRDISRTGNHRWAVGEVEALARRVVKNMVNAGHFKEGTY